MAVVSLLLFIIIPICYFCWNNEETKPINVGECPFTPESLQLNLNWIDDEPEENKIVGIITDHLKDLYNIFFHYSTFYK